MSQSKLFEDLYVLFMFGHFFRKGGGLPDSKLFAELFSLCLEIFQGEVGLPYSKTFEELFCLSLDIFQEERGGYLIPKMMRTFFLLSVRHFPMKIGEGDQNPNTLRNFSLTKIRF